MIVRQDSAAETCCWNIGPIIRPNILSNTEAECVTAKLDILVELNREHSIGNGHFTNT